MSDDTRELKIIDGLKLSDERRALLRPGEAVTDERGRTHFLPRFFYEINSWTQANAMQFSAHFTFAEMMNVDCREADVLLNTFPHYVPCAVVVFARYLQAFREKVDAPVCIATNGGYRSPAHKFSLKNERDSRGLRERDDQKNSAAAIVASPHLFGTAANIFRIGDTFLDNEKAIEKYARIAAAIAPEIYAKPFGHGAEETDDHLHIDIGYVTCVPRDCDEARPS